jgi:hypothetical protein
MGHIFRLRTLASRFHLVGRQFLSTFLRSEANRGTPRGFAEIANKKELKMAFADAPLETETPAADAAGITPEQAIMQIIVRAVTALEDISVSLQIIAANTSEDEEEEGVPVVQP